MAGDSVSVVQPDHELARASGGRGKLKQSVILAKDAGTSRLKRFGGDKCISQRGDINGLRPALRPRSRFAEL
jgi:hypothetical protein